VLLSSLKRSGAFPALMEFLVNSTTVLNGFDQYGHYQRTNILVSTCIFYQQPDHFPGCGANFTGPARAGRLSGYPSSRQAMLRMLREATSQSGGTLAIPDPDERGDATGLLPALPTDPASPTAPADPDDPSGAGDTTGSGGDQDPDGVSDAAPRPGGSTSNRGGTALLDYLLGP
jgi:hypothetical protein